MKQIAAVLVLLGVLALGANIYYGKQIEKQLERAAQLMRGMGGRLDYVRVKITPDGSIQVENVRISAPGMPQDLFAERVVLRTGSIIGVHKLAMDVRNKRVPQQLGVSILGAKVFLDDDNFDQLSAMRTNGASLSAAGCGERRRFSGPDFVAMGYPDTVLMDAHLDFRTIANEWFELALRSVTEDMHDVSIKIDFSMQAASRDMAATAMAMAGAEVNELRLDYKDLGYAARILDFCQRASGLEPAEYIDVHLQAWQNAWQSSGFMAGNVMLAAYGQFLQQPESMGISARPRSKLTLVGMSALAPDLLPYQFQTTLEVNGSVVGAIDLTAMNQAERQAWQLANPGQAAATAAAAKPKVQTADLRSAEPTRSGPQAVTVTQLRDHLNAQVTLRLATGKILEGRIRRFDPDYLQLQSYLSGGTIIVPVAYADIAEAQLK